MALSEPKSTAPAPANADADRVLTEIQEFTRFRERELMAKVC